LTNIDKTFIRRDTYMFINPIDRVIKLKSLFFTKILKMCPKVFFSA